MIFKNILFLILCICVQVYLCVYVYAYDYWPLRRPELLDPLVLELEAVVRNPRRELGTPFLCNSSMHS